MPPTNEERLARIETNTELMRESLSELRTLVTAFGARIQEEETRGVRCQADMKADLKMLRYGVGLALFASLGGGGAAVVKFLGILP